MYGLGYIPCLRAFEKLWEHPEGLRYMRWEALRTSLQLASPEEEGPGKLQGNTQILRATKGYKGPTLRVCF